MLSKFNAKTLQHSIPATEHAKDEGADYVNGRRNIKNNRPFFLRLVAHNVTGENRAHYTGDSSYDIFYTEHVACDEGSDVKVIACSTVLIHLESPRHFNPVNKLTSVTCH